MDGAGAVAGGDLFRIHCFGDEIASELESAECIAGGIRSSPPPITEHIGLFHCRPDWYSQIVCAKEAKRKGCDESLRDRIEPALGLGYHLAAGQREGHVLLLVHGAGRVQPQDRRA